MITQAQANALYIMNAYKYRLSVFQENAKNGSAKIGKKSNSTWAPCSDTITPNNVARIALISQSARAIVSKRNRNNKRLQP